MDIQQLSDREIVKQILVHARDYQVTVAELVVIFDIDIYEAKALLKRLLKSQLVSRLRKGVQHIYVINRSIQQQHYVSGQNRGNTSLKQQLEEVQKIALPSTPEPTVERIKIPDADVIQLAIEHDGRLTPTLLCLKHKISIEEAKQKLEMLYEQGTFVVDVDESNYVMGYQLRDKSLLK
jgi:predicted transcriptional regulator